MGLKPCSHWSCCVYFFLIAISFFFVIGYWKMASASSFVFSIYAICVTCLAPFVSTYFTSIFEISIKRVLLSFFYIFYIFCFYFFYCFRVIVYPVSGSNVFPIFDNYWCFICIIFIDFCCFGLFSIFYYAFVTLYLSVVTLWSVLLCIVAFLPIKTWF